MGKPQLMKMSPGSALKWLIPGAVAVLVTIILSIFQGPHTVVLVLVVALAGFTPSAVVVAWGTIKFRSYYEVERTRADLKIMAYTCLLQLPAVGVCAYLFVKILEALDAIRGI
ncbi:hypothetical protein [Arthrobacter sp.]|uniref:hypothetical protein n=1 Tax=Arthrobacter sp. TaxID=1667 RepID=UPI003A92A9D7